MNVHVVKTVPVTYQMVVEAYRKVKRGGKAAGIDQESWADFEQKGAERELYVIWNRMASGSYFPQAVREVEIPKKDGKLRKLGIPTVRDRIAQEVVKRYMEQRVDERFHPNSYGYRPLKSSRQAIEQVRQNCLKLDWVIDMDISKFFDEINHELLLKAVDAMELENWVKMYVQRWLQMKVVKADGTIYDRGNKGTPQGGVISPLLANLFLHYGLDKWLEKNYPQIRFVRYADDAVVHCKEKSEAEQLLSAIRERMKEIGLRLNDEKTRIVYCKDYRRKQNHEHVQFGFLGFSYQPRQTQVKGNRFMAFTAEISKDNQKKIREKIRETVKWRNTTKKIEQIAEELNSKLRGWINYFELYSKRQLRKTMFYLEEKLVKWLSRKHKHGIRKSLAQMRQLRQRKPKLFYHWEKGYC
ncbi:MAG TPA: group II intron reverse transcriptase/maturase [Chlamydiales bacterium]|nr:group II intron reverse transcriptase/maturase [Chlamydiales bacterium]